jgi:hypothetical protein
VSGYVYFIGAIITEGESAAVKIGYSSSDPRKRLQKLQIGNPDKLYMLAWESGTFDDERALHRRFDHLWLRGEWFRYEGELESYLLALLDAQFEEAMAEA